MRSWNDVKVEKALRDKANGRDMHKARADARARTRACVETAST